MLQVFICADDEFFFVVWPSGLAGEEEKKKTRAGLGLYIGSLNCCRPLKWPLTVGWLPGVRKAISTLLDQWKGDCLPTSLCNIFFIWNRSCLQIPEKRAREFSDKKEHTLKSESKRTWLLDSAVHITDLVKSYRWGPKHIWIASYYVLESLPATILESDKIHCGAVGLAKLPKGFQTTSAAQVTSYYHIGNVPDYVVS